MIQSVNAPAPPTPRMRAYKIASAEWRAGNIEQQLA